MNITTEEASKVLAALNQWFKSQKIDHVDAAFVCTLYVSTFIAAYASNEAAIETGLKMANETMRDIISARREQLSDFKKRNMQ